MVTVDSLDIQIQASAQKANSTIDALNEKLNILATSLAKINGSAITGLANGVNRLSTAMQGMKSVGTADFTRLAKNIENLGKIDTSGLNSAASSLSHISRTLSGFESASAASAQLGEMAKNIAKLGNKSVQTAITNIPLLATAMKDLMQTLSTAPRVSQNLIDMTNALTNFTQQGSKVSAVSGTLTTGLNRSSKAMNNAKKSSTSLAAAFGKFYATYFLLIRGIKGFMRSIESTTDYIEAFNYYNVAFGKIASEWDKEFEKYGYENAESYAESFTERMNETLGKLSGVQVNLDTGLLEETGLQNLGLNIQQITQYASQLASVTNSIGQTGEVSLAAAKSMTMLAGDISSLFNVDYQSVANNLQSGLIGQSRALYKYGIDITNATLANYAYNLGLEKSVSEMTQAEKMQLRLLAILDQSKVSWGDLSNTINSPSNMLRQFTNNAKELSMVFGQLFIPVLQKVMPVINGITIALKRLLVSFAQILGIKIDFDAFGQGYSDMEEGADDLSDALGGVAESAKKAKAGLRAFDELKVINMPDTSAAGVGGGVGGAIDLTDEILKATEEYEKAWNEAFAKMENTAQAWADKIEKALEPIKKIFQDFAIGDFFQAGKDTSALVAGIFDFFADAIDRVDWNGIGQKIGDFLAGIDWFAILKSVGNLIWQAIKASLELWAGSFKAAPIETGILTALGLMKFRKFGDKVRPKIVSAIINTELATSLITAWKSLGGLGGILGTDLETIMGAGTAAEIGVTIVTGIMASIATAIVSFEFGKWLGKQLFPEDAEYYENFKWTGEGGFFDTISSDWETSFQALDQMWAEIQNNKFVQFMTGDLTGLMGKEHKTWDETKKEIADAFSWIKDEISREWNVAMENIDTISNWYENSVKPWLSREKWLELGGNIGYGLMQKWGDFSKWWEESGAKNWFETRVKPVFSEKNWMFNGIKGGLFQSWTDFTKWWREGNGAKNWFETIVKPVFSANNWNFNGIADGLTQAWKNAVDSIKNIWNEFASWLDEILNFSWNPIKISGKEIVSGGNVKLGSIKKFPTYATGGFPEDGWFRASHGEIMGQFDNGQSVVANNYQITEGIAEAVYNAVSSAIRNNNGTGGDITIQLNLDGEVVYRDIIKRTQDQSRRTFGGRLVLADEVF